MHHSFSCASANPRPSASERDLPGDSSLRGLRRCDLFPPRAFCSEGASWAAPAELALEPWGLGASSRALTWTVARYHVPRQCTIAADLDNMLSGPPRYCQTVRKRSTSPFCVLFLTRSSASFQNTCPSRSVSWCGRSSRQAIRAPRNEPLLRQRLAVGPKPKAYASRSS